MTDKSNFTRRMEASSGERRLGCRTQRPVVQCAMRRML